LEETQESLREWSMRALASEMESINQYEEKTILEAEDVTDTGITIEFDPKETFSTENNVNKNLKKKI
jgi:hypothetical protein